MWSWYYDHMTHSNLVSAFESGEVDHTAFGHRQHMHVIWALVHAHGTLEALRRFEAGLKRITAAAGHPEKYHATITYAFGFLVADRVAEQGPLSWDDFEASNPDLFDWPSTALARLYPNDVLASEAARRHFVLPNDGRRLAASS